MALEILQPHTCGFCSPFVLSFGGYPASGKFREVGKHGQKAFMSDLSVEQALHAAERGCLFMSWATALPTPGRFLRALLFQYPSGVTTLWFEWVDEADENVLGGLEELTVYATGNNPAALEITTRPPNPSPGDIETFSLARRWLRECIDNHDACPEPRITDVTPRRLIQVNGTVVDPLIKLVSVNSSPQAPRPYAALSYCWGGEQCHILRRTVSDSWQFEIPYSRLPQTIKDAIRVTQEIGLQYLWIDALCIVQDDLQDKRDQIACMAEIYEQAFVTISAARAHTAEEGFLHSIKESKGPAQTGFKLPFRSSNGELGSVTLLNSKPGGYGWHEPLDNRGWALQETLVSSRILEYGTTQVRWRCHSKNYVDGWTRRKQRNWDPEIDWRLAASSTHVDVRKWKLLVSEYSTRSLKEPADKLLAVSAVAKKLGQLSEDYYIAGLWRHSFMELLLWHCSYDITTGSSNGRYPAEYRAPSWSWASIDGTIFWETYVGVHAEILDTQVETVPSNSPYGTITASYITLSGQSYSVVVTKGSEILHPDLNESIPGCIWFDTHDEGLDQRIWAQKILLFQITIVDKRSTGLVLQEKENGRYCRVGLYNLHSLRKEQGIHAPRDWINRKVTIV